MLPEVGPAEGSCCCCCWECCELWDNDREPDWIELGLVEPAAVVVPGLDPEPMVVEPVPAEVPNAAASEDRVAAMYGGGAGVAAGLAVAGGGRLEDAAVRPRRNVELL